VDIDVNVNESKKGNPAIIELHMSYVKKMEGKKTSAKVSKKRKVAPQILQMTTPRTLKSQAHGNY